MAPTVQHTVGVCLVLATSKAETLHDDPDQDRAHDRQRNGPRNPGLTRLADYPGHARSAGRNGRDRVGSVGRLNGTERGA